MTRSFLRAGLLALVGLAFGAGNLLAETPGKSTPSFGRLQSPSAEAVRGEALGWLKETGKADAAGLKQFEAIWNSDAAVIDRVADTLALGDDTARKLLADARDPATAAPTALPAPIKNSNANAFYRSNLALAYAKALSNRRVHEEALDALRLIKPESVVDPAGYFFIRAVAEHALLLKNEAFRSIVGVVEDVADAPDRYKIGSLP